MKNIKNNKKESKIAVVTGGAGLLGRQHCIALTEIGCKVIILEKDIKKAKTFLHSLKVDKINQNIYFLKTDIVRFKDVIKISKKISKSFGNVDILINNAANNPKISKKNFNNLDNFNHDTWKKDLDVGLTGSLNCTIVFGSEMAKRKNGIILNIASDLSVIAPDQRLYNIGKKIKTAKPVSYSVVKSGLIGMTKYFATYWHAEGIRVNALSPGGVYNNQDKNFVKKLKKLIPLNRMANIDEYKGAIKFLCSDESSYMTGQNIIIDGGRSVW